MNLLDIVKRLDYWHFDKEPTNNIRCSFNKTITKNLSIRAFYYLINTSWYCGVFYSFLSCLSVDQSVGLVYYLSVLIS